MSDPPPSPSEPMSRGIGLHGFRVAVLAMWGDDGLRAIAARLADDVRAATMESIVLPVAWYPVRYTIAWDEAVWDGPAARDDVAFCRFLDQAIEAGFGRMRRFFVRLQSPQRIIERCPEMWRYQHSHGTLTATGRDGGATITLRDHPFARHPIARRATAEVYRHIAAMTRAGRGASAAETSSVRETHGAEGPDTLVVRLSWSAR